MDESTLERHLVENEATFRDLNGRMQKSLNRANEDVDATYRTHTNHRATMPMYFFCECSDEKCQKQIKISPQAYDKIHKDNAKFILIPGHEIGKIENVVEKYPEYYVVKKTIQPPKHSEHLKPTQ
jgi:hypothetical protein